MGNRRWFSIESKSFEFNVEECGGILSLCIIERGRNKVHTISLGTKGMEWLRQGMIEVHGHPKDIGFIRTLWEDSKTFVLQKNRNEKGRFLLVIEFGVQRRHDSLVIPEGDDLWGWRGFSLAMNGILGKIQLAMEGAGPSKGGQAVPITTTVRKT